MTERLWNSPGPEEPQRVRRRGYDLIRDPLLNKGSAFTTEERGYLGLEGLLPVGVNTMEQQITRFMESLVHFKDPMDKYVELAELHDRNEQLFYRVLIDDLPALMPIVYTPTVGRATREFSHVFRRGRGVWLSPDQSGRMDEVLESATGERDIRLIVATDNQSILGIGDQGAGGMAISIGKLSLYCAAAGIPPALTLPVSLDVGTDNASLLEDPLYLGWRHRRLSGDAYYDFIEEFVEAVAKVLPRALVQWEDFRKDRAHTILDRYRRRVLSFNDDIQGTGAVTLAGIIAAVRKLGGKLSDHRFLIYGAGAAGLGIARQIRMAIEKEGGHRHDIAALDSRGLLVDDVEFSDSYKNELAWPLELAKERGVDGPGGRDLLSVVKAFRPTVLIGTSGRPGAFNRAVIESAREHCEAPIVLPFSNPTDYAEARPGEVLRWTNGSAIVATGSPFADVNLDGRTFRIGQGNNVFIFPGLGLGSLLSRAEYVSDGMISATAVALAEEVTQEELDKGMVYPEIGRLRDVSRVVAAAVMRAASDEGVGDSLEDSEIESRIDAAFWDPRYRRYVAA
ncbi:MAG: NAD-dependent malic enzyme [Gammaproteobacteria bacterium]|jgi:malic enzyme